MTYTLHHGKTELARAATAGEAIEIAGRHVAASRQRLNRAENLLTSSGFVTVSAKGKTIEIRSTNA